MSLVLVVEDEPKLREPLVHLLQLRNYEVVAADTVDGALAALQSRKPDAGIIDLQLKAGSGRDVIVRMPAKAPVIIFSGMCSESGHLERLRPRTRLVEKPASLTWVIDSLGEMIERTRIYES
jgi:DNA-binding response OmpR family regulator